MTGVTQSASSEFDRARALLADKREDEALDWFELASEQAGDPAVRSSAAAHVAALLLGFRRPWEVAEFTGRMRRDGGDEALAAMLDASACVQLGDSVGALQVLGVGGAIAEPRDAWFPCTRFDAWAVRIRSLHLASRDDDAIAELHRAFATAPSAPALWETAATLVADGALAAADVLAYLRPDDATALFGWIAGAPVAGIDRLADALWSRQPGSASVLAAATLFAWRLPTDDALRWSVRLASSGASDRSPIHERAERPSIPADDRLRAAVAGAVLDAERSRAALASIVPAIADEQLLELFDHVVDGANPLADSYILAAATTTNRCLLLASELVRRGHDEAGFALLVAGLSLPSADALTRDTFDELVPERERGVLTDVALRRGDDEVAGILASVSQS